MAATQGEREPRTDGRSAMLTLGDAWRLTEADLRLVFDRIDLNKDQQLSKTEFTASLEALSIEPAVLHYSAVWRLILCAGCQSYRHSTVSTLRSLQDRQFEL